MRSKILRTFLIPIVFGLAGLHGRRNDTDSPDPSDSSGNPQRQSPLNEGSHARDTEEGIRRAKEARVGGQSASPTPDSDSPATTPTRDPRQEAFDDLPPFTRNGVDENGNRIFQSPTSGYLLDANGDRIPNPHSTDNDPDLFDSSGLNRPPAPDVEDRIRESPSPYPPGSSRVGWRSDVEMKASDLARNDEIDNAELVINNPDGPCPGCDRTLPYVLGPNQTMTVFWPGGPPEGKPYTGANW